MFPCRSCERKKGHKLSCDSKHVLLWAFCALLANTKSNTILLCTITIDSCSVQNSSKHQCELVFSPLFLFVCLYMSFCMQVTCLIYCTGKKVQQTLKQRPYYTAFSLCYKIQVESSRLNIQRNKICWLSLITLNHGAEICCFLE